MEDFVNTGNQQSNKSPIILFLIFGIINFWGLILAIIEYFVFFRFLKWKISMDTLFVSIVSLFLILIGFIIHPFSNLELSVNKLIFPYIYLSFWFGLFGGYLFIIWQAWQLKSYPELKKMQGWAKDFQYEKSIFEKIKKKKLIKNLRNGNELSYDAAPMGVLEEPIKLNNEEEIDGEYIISRYYEEGYKTTLITGAPGSGKTISMLNLMYNDIAAGYPICVLDFKKGADVAYLLSKWAKQNKRKFYHFVSGDVGCYKNPYCKYQASYDPLATGTATSKADMILNLRKWDSNSDVYKNRTQSILQTIFYLLENVDREALPKIPWEQGGIAQFVAALQLPNLFDMIEWMKKDIQTREASEGEKRRLNELLQFYNNVTSGRDSTLKGQIEELSIICRTLIMSNYSDWLAKGETPNHINLFEFAMSKKAPIVLFQFNPNEEPEFAKYMGYIILSDLKRASSYKYAKGNKNPFGVYIDEFQILDPMAVVDVIDKVRSAVVFPTLSLQSLEQISRAADRNGEVILKSVLDSASNFIVHNGSSYDTAERFSKIVGKTNKTSYKTFGNRSSKILSWNLKSSRQSAVNMTEEEDWKISPSEFQELSSPTSANDYTSTAYYITKECSDPLLAGKSQVIGRKMKVIVNEDVLEPTPESFKKNLFNTTNQKKRIKKLEDIKNKDEILYEDNIFKIEEDNSNLEQLANVLLEQEGLSDEEFNKRYKRDNLEKTKKKTTFEEMMKK